jgi:Uma2 family endonuclease
MRSFLIRYPHLYVWPEQQVRTIRNRCRIPDVCVTLQEPEPDVFETAPLICIETLSRRDEMSNVLEKLDEYFAIRVPYIWLIDPRRKRAFTYNGKLQEQAEPGFSTAGNPLIELPFADVFQGL